MTARLLTAGVLLAFSVPASATSPVCATVGYATPVPVSARLCNLPQTGDGTYDGPCTTVDSWPPAPRGRSEVCMDLT